LPIGWQVLPIQVYHLFSAHLASNDGDLSGAEDQQVNLGLGTTAGPSHVNSEATMRLLEQLAQSNAQLAQLNAQLTQLMQSNTQLMQSNARLFTENASLLEIIAALQYTI
jgi:hypothetical protein